MVARLTSRRILVALAAVAAALELAVAATGVADVVRAGREGFDDRPSFVRNGDLDPLASYASTAALALARETIPPDATYTIVVGDDPPVRGHGAVKFALRFWLQPRRYTPSVEHAEWVIAYHASSELLGIRYRREVGLGPHANAVEVTR